MHLEPVDSFNRQNHLQTVIQNMPVMMDAFDDNWNIIVWNRECERVTGYRSAEIVGNPNAMKMLYPDDVYREKMITEWDTRGNDYYNWEWNITCKQGDVKTISWSNISGRFPIDGWWSWGIGVDVTEKKLAEQELALRNRLAVLFLTVSDDELFKELLKVVLEVTESRFGVFGYIDDNGDLVTPTMTYDIWDQCKVSGYKIVFPHDSWGKSLWVRAIREKKIKYANKPSVNIPEGHIPINRNVAAPIIYSGQVIGLIHVANKAVDYSRKDLQRLAGIADYIAPILNSRLSRNRQKTYRLKAEASLKASEERYRALVESVSNGVALIQDKTFILVNPAFLQIFDYESADIPTEKNNTALMNQKFRHDFSSVFEKLTENSTDNHSFRRQCTDGKGRSFWIEAVHKSISHLGKPAALFSIGDITSAVHKEISVKKEAEKLRSENVFLRSSIKERYRFGNIIGKSQAMQQVYEQILKAAACDANVIITGESGTGKELVANAIHSMGSRSNRAFITVNCGAIPETLIESEFFGYRKGAFTNALIDKQGFISGANKGTLFLDEVGEISQGLQSKLLRTIETGEYIRIGDNRPQHANIRIIAATNKDFQALMQSGQIREDFYFRLAIITIHLPPLRQRREDISLLVDHFISQFNPDKGHADLPAHDIARISSYDWPGNVRELQSAIRRYYAVGKLGLPTDPVATCNPASETGNGESSHHLKQALEHFEKQFIHGVLASHQWHKGKTASYLGIDPKTLYRKMIKLGL